MTHERPTARTDDRPANTTDERPAAAPRPLTLDDLKARAEYHEDARFHDAVRELEAQAEQPPGLDSWVAVLLIALVATGVSLTAGTALARTILPDYLQRGLQLLATFLAVVLTIRWVQRWGAPRDLRGALLDRGIPLCGRCAGLVRRSDPAVAVCPHCGAPCDERLRELLDWQSESPE